MKAKSLISLVIAGVIGLSGPTIAGPEINTSMGAVLVGGKAGPGLAAHGFDVVAYFSEAKPVQGNAKFAVVHNDATYRFASQAHLNSFKANPAKYAPAYGGYCAYGVSVGAKFDGDPRYWKIVDGNLYLSLDVNIQQAWLKDVPGAIKKANSNWPKLASKLTSEI